MVIELMVVIRLMMVFSYLEILRLVTAFIVFIVSTLIVSCSPATRGRRRVAEIRAVNVRMRGRLLAEFDPGRHDNPTDAVGSGELRVES